MKKIDWEDRATRLAYAIYGMMEGDDPEYAAKLLEDYGYTDKETGDWIYDEDED